MIQIYHNSRCGKSRECLTFLVDCGQEYEVINYLENRPTFEELETIIKKLDIQPIELVRRKEKIWIEKYKDIALSHAEIIQALVSHPILIERPIVINGERAVIARPSEKTATVL